ncbi:ADP-ribosylation factor-like protein 6-interacting protein 4 isoform X1 [Vespa mandarinia]|uniref:ADP-ribosylation factor-like protein 6-interacting protein 4 isoform X1 n=2 Tax=Vespa mandarinia TaxID=7446 RepID=UPI0016113B69|nr:ADP-ribosylation factor-like protein 6-interacting protein 4 isoform X1 [Vespa mandarinia]XP_035719746.1 ADP-ribosylation factor-like protein 6-interacting protein 4 isoform X1 [Vespa mandarinia]XP_046819489.1 ADP-ribosylation factor-like protein 6-interacting protein 4 isoform X1 [Vespa crabro]XP_046819490.1 ADP-ribosylation factor-like protein 6-interacting protein 4 isoform X1 [Vespa crabro]
MSGRESNETKCERSSRSKRHRMKEQTQSTHSDGSDSKLKRRSACSKDKRKKSRHRSSSSSSSSSSTSSHDVKLQKTRKKKKDDDRTFKEYKNGIIPQRMDRTVNNYKGSRNYNVLPHNFRERGNTSMRGSYKYGRFYNRNRRIPYNNYQYYRRNNEGRNYYTHYNNRVPNYNRSRNNQDQNIDYQRNSNKDASNQFVRESNSRDSSSKQEKCSLKIDKIQNIKTNVDPSHTKTREKRKADCLEGKPDHRTQKKRKRRSSSSSSSSSTSSTSSGSSSSSSTSSSSSSSSSTSSTSSSDSSEDERKRKKQKKKAKRVKKNVKKHRKKRKLKKNPKKKLKKSLATENKKRTSDKSKDTVTEISPEMSERAKLMAPITKEEWEKKQSLIRRVYDEETGRYRLIKGDGEIIEEIVSRERHKEINRQATKGDGDYFQARLKGNIL